MKRSLFLVAAFASLAISQTAIQQGYDVRTYQFARTSGLGASGTLTSAGSGKVITFSASPKGIVTGQQVYISGGTGAGEAVPVTATTCVVAGGTSCTITVTTANAHSGAWVVQSATAGWQEAAQAAGANKAVYFSPGTYNLYGSFTVPFSGQTYYGDSPSVVTITTPNGTNLSKFAITGATSDVSFLRLGWEGNFINQTHPAATLNSAIDGTNSVRLKVQGNRFHAFGYTTSADAAYAQVVSLYSSLACQVRDNLFLSNMAQEINMNGVAGCAITGNTFGSPNLSESQANVNWWDTYSGGFGTLIIGSSDVYFADNRMFGSARSSTLSAYGYLISSGGGFVQGRNLQIHNNVFQGLGNSRGTVAVTNGSGTITGTNTSFNTLDVTRTFKVEGDLTEYTITAYSSATAITVTPVIARASASGLRYLYQNSGDVISPASILGMSITGNAVYDSGDMAYHISAANGSAQITTNVVFANNIASRSQVAGLFVGGSVWGAQVSGNLFENNNRKQQSGHLGAIELSPAYQGLFTPQAIWHINFSNNLFIDTTNTAPTQKYGFQMESGQSALIFSNTLSGNTYHSYTGGGAMFDPATTTTMQGTMFNQPQISNVAQYTPTAFSSLSILNGGNGTPVDGMFAFCIDCTVTSGASNVCAGSGTGALAMRLNGAWRCFNAQN